VRSEGGGVKINRGRERTATARSEARDEAAVCSEAGNKATVCSRARIEDDR
jgi:hypothetical protein